MRRAGQTIARAIEIAGHLAVWTGLYVGAAVLCFAQTAGVAISPWSRRGASVYVCAFATAMGVYLLDRVKASDRWLDAADAAAKPARVAFLSRRRGLWRGWVVALGMVGAATGWLVHLWAAVLVPGAFAGVLMYGGRPGHLHGRRLKDVFLVKNAAVAGAITVFAVGLVLLADAASAPIADGVHPAWRIAGGAGVLLFGRVFADAALCDIDDEEADRRYGTATLPARIGRRRTWALVMLLNAGLVIAAALLPAPAEVIRARLLWAGLALITGLAMRLWDPPYLRDLIDARFAAVGLIALAAAR
jgi:4-hydroxybenzoate polyprenyltransferase